MSKIQINLNIYGEVDVGALATFLSAVGTSTPAADEQPKPTPRTAKPKAEEQADTKSQPEVKGKDAAGDEVSEVPTVDEVTKAGMAYAKANGRDAFVELLAGYDAKNVSGVPEDKRAELLAKLEA